MASAEAGDGIAGLGSTPGTMWRPMAGSWPSPRQGEMDCWSEMSMVFELEVAGAVVRQSKDVVRSAVAVEAVRLLQSLDSIVSSTSNTFLRPPVSWWPSDSRTL